MMTSCRQARRRAKRAAATAAQTSRTAQGKLHFRTWGGKRAGAGRKARSGRAGVSHRGRPEHDAHHPVHVTLRASRGLVSLRRQVVFSALRCALARASRPRSRIVQFSVQSDHVHLIVEAEGKVELSRGVAGLSIRMARAVNGVLGRRGKIWGDRYHARALRSPREVRSALVYVLTNWRKHIAGVRGHDPCSSAMWFDGWLTRPSGSAHPGDGGPPSPVQRARTWLGSTAWRRHGLVRLDDRPAGGR
jgi:putative transposase